ncbi:unnamed protein product, partial [Effrenium voratum]
QPGPGPCHRALQQLDLHGCLPHEAHRPRQGSHLRGGEGHHQPAQGLGTGVLLQRLHRGRGGGQLLGPACWGRRAVRLRLPRLRDLGPGSPGAGGGGG